MEKILPRVLFVTDDAPDKFGGTTTFLVRLLGALKARGFEVSVLVIADTGGETGESTRDCLSLGVEVCTAARRSVRENVAWIFSQVRRIRPSVLVAYESSEACYAAKQLRRETGMATVRIGHTDDAGEARFTEAFCQGGEEGAFSVLIPVSRSLEEKYLAAAQGASRVVRIPYGAPDPGPTFRARWGDDTFTLVYVGRLLQFQKRILEVTQAFVEACRRNPHVKAVMIGDGPEGGAVREIIRSSGVADRITLLGRLPAGEVARVVSNCQAVVLLSDFEGIPVAIMEALAMGVVPVLLTSQSGILELVVQDRTGLLCEDRGEGFQAAVSRLAGDEALWVRLSEGGRAHYEAEFSQEKAMERWAGVLDSLTSTSVRWPSAGAGLVPIFPSAHWTKPWADASMGTGWVAAKHALAGTFWRIWKLIPAKLRWALRDAARKTGVRFTSN